MPCDLNIIIITTNKFNYSCYLTKHHFTACCEKIELHSTISNKEKLKGLGRYVLQPTDIVENHVVYKHDSSDKHIAFSTKYGWTVSWLDRLKY